ncbi:MAG: UDP-glucose--hexose-1-phosphate uridylyltransferase [Oscillospiraceae bacterium]
MIDNAVSELVEYSVRTGLIGDLDRVWASNSLLELLGLSDYSPGQVPPPRPLENILDELTDFAALHGISPDGQWSRDLFSAKLMGRLTPPPSQVISKFRSEYSLSPKRATDWYYKFSQDTDYIRRYRISRDLKWKTETPYGALDITINLAKPEKDPKAIAAAGSAPQSGYPKCLLCRENEGFSGDFRRPARQNHRVIPIELCKGRWFLQYSPYVYYNEHCIVISHEHAPMHIGSSTFNCLLDFVRQFPHYFVGSNADLPIVGGSILSHNHFQGGRYTFPMELAPIERDILFPAFPDVKAGIVRWPMSVIRLRSADSSRLSELACRILSAWRSYTDAAAFIYAETDGVPHNTITPIARRRDGEFELDLVLRNNITTEEYPQGVYHPHPELHHIKKENIGLIEVMGLAVLPARLKTELEKLAEVLISGGGLYSDDDIIKHASWAERLREKYDFTEANAAEILKFEIGRVFVRILEQSGVFKCTEQGRDAFMRFIDSVK